MKKGRNSFSKATLNIFKLINKRSGTSDLCVFNELHAANGFFEFQSASNSSWYIGFGRTGRRLPGSVSMVANSVDPRRDVVDVIGSLATPPLGGDAGGRLVRKSASTPPSMPSQAPYYPAASLIEGGSVVGGGDKATALRQCYQFTKTDFPYIGDPIGHGTIDDADDLRRLGDDGSTTDDATSGGSRWSGSVRGGSDDRHHPWAPRIDYSDWFAKRRFLNDRSRRPSGNVSDARREQRKPPGYHERRRQSLQQRKKTS